MVVVKVKAGVAPPDDDPAKPLAVATDTDVTVPCGWAGFHGAAPVVVEV